MKKLALIVALLLISSSAMAITITAVGYNYAGGFTDETSAWIGIGALVEVLDDGGAVVGAGNFFDGGGFAMFNVGPIDVGAVAVGTEYAVKIYNNAGTFSGMTPYMAVSTIPDVAQGEVAADTVYQIDGLQTLTPEDVIPEPSILLSGLALLVLRRKK